MAELPEITLTRSDSPPIMPLRRNSELPIDQTEVNNTEGNHDEASHAADPPPGPVLPQAEGGTLTLEHLYRLIQDLTQSVAIMKDHQAVTQARLDALITARTLAEPNRPNPNPYLTEGNQTRGPVAPPNILPVHANTNPPPYVAPAYINVPPVQDPLTAGLNPELNQPLRNRNPQVAKAKKASSRHKKVTLATNQDWPYQKWSNRKKGRPFSRLATTLSQTLATLQAEGILQPLAPRAPPNPAPSGWNANERCTYHQGLGHNTNKCSALKHAIQDLIDSGMITLR